MKRIVHTKVHYGIEDLELKFSKKRPTEGLISKELKFKRHKSAVGMGMGNKRIWLFTFCYNPVASKLYTT